MRGRAIVKHLRIPVMVAYVIAWNALLLSGMLLGGKGFTYESTVATVMLIVALVGTAIFAILVAFSSRVQSVTLRSTENMSELRVELLFIVVLTGFLAAMSTVSLVTK